MKNLKMTMLTATLAIFAALSLKADAAGVGFINYQKVQENYSFAIQKLFLFENKIT